MIFPSFRARASSSRRSSLAPPRAGLWTFADETVLIGAAPLGFLGHPRTLKELGVSGVVNVCSEYAGPVGEYKRLCIDQLHLPVDDHIEPSLEDMQSAVRFISEHKPSSRVEVKSSRRK